MENESLCQCGCGQPAPIATKTDASRGAKKGQPRRFIYGHHSKGKHLGRWNMKTREERFFAKVKKTATCWLWTGGNAGDGYGSFDQRRAHRVAHEMFVGPIPSGMSVCHRCDVPMCVRPDHLFLGTPKDNSRDMVQKGRSKHRKV